MSGNIRIIGTVVLCFQLAGCGGYRGGGGGIPEHDATTAAGETDDGALTVGDDVRVTLESGEVITGKIQQMDASGFVVKPRDWDSSGRGLRTLDRADIARLEKLESSSLVGLGLALLAAAAFFGVATLIYQSSGE